MTRLDCWSCCTFFHSGGTLIRKTLFSSSLLIVKRTKGMQIVSLVCMTMDEKLVQSISILSYSRDRKILLGAGCWVSNLCLTSELIWLNLFLCLRTISALHPISRYKPWLSKKEPLDLLSDVQNEIYAGLFAIVKLLVSCLSRPNKKLMTHKKQIPDPLNLSLCHLISWSLMAAQQQLDLRKRSESSSGDSWVLRVPPVPPVPPVVLYTDSLPASQLAQFVKWVTHKSFPH